MTGEQAVRCVEIIGPRMAVPIRYNDFSVFQSGLDDVKQAAEASTPETEFHYVSHGDEHRFRTTR
ncbi:hypothetical protein ACLFMI_13820 [Pseudonocardia nantongensis]|uniref:hypothetical protein n=1 Tax=Pseudonocardia nantongensis TaxID=1181885 RepID=UPI00397D9A4D